MNPTEDRRRVQRVTLLEPLRGTVGVIRVFVIDLSLRGVKIAHRENIGRVGTNCVLRSEWEGQRIELHCTIIHSRLQRTPVTATGAELYHTGLLIHEARGTSSQTLRAIIESHVSRAMDEQKANARGIPPRAVQWAQAAKARHYIRHELVHGRWREVTTTDPAQPENGFTLAADHTPREVEMLRLAYERGAATGDRSMIRRLAQLSIGSTEAVAVRRYAP